MYFKDTTLYNYYIYVWHGTSYKNESLFNKSGQFEIILKSFYLREKKIDLPQINLISTIHHSLFDVSDPWNFLKN